MTEEQLKFIKDLVEKMRIQDNRATQYPLFYVYERKERECAENEDPDKIKWMNTDWEEVREHTDDAGNLWLASDDGSWTCTALDKNLDLDEFEEEITTEYTRLNIKEYDAPIVSVGPFFTEAAAQAHIDANDYHYNKPFIFVNSAWRNDEVQEILKIIFALAGQEVPSQYK